MKKVKPIPKEAPSYLVETRKGTKVPDLEINVELVECSLESRKREADKPLYLIRYE